MLKFLKKSLIWKKSIIEKDRIDQYLTDLLLIKKALRKLDYLDSITLFSKNGILIIDILLIKDLI